MAASVCFLSMLVVFAPQGQCDTVTYENVYLGSIYEWNPKEVGVSRRFNNWSGMTDGVTMPAQNNRALGAPTGNGTYSRVYNGTAVGINGSASWKFEEGFYIYNGPGNDFKTFEGSFAWGYSVDGLCCELGHIQVSEDGQNWYYNSAEKYIVNPNPDVSNGDYSYSAVEGLHGNNPTWANAEKDMQAQEIRDGKWVNIPDTYISKDFKPTDPYLGGNDFDLSTFRSLEDDSFWPDDGKMFYIRLIDDSTILDGQDYAKGWCFGAQMHAAMGLNVMAIDSVPVPGAFSLLCVGLLGLAGLRRKN